MGVGLIDVHASPTWGRGIQALSAVLEREHDTRPWAEPDDDAKTLEVSLPWGGRILAPAAAVVRWRGDAVLILAAGVVRIVTPAGEVMLDPSEQSALLAYWSDI